MLGLRSPPTPYIWEFFLLLFTLSETGHSGRRCETDSSKLSIILRASLEMAATLAHILGLVQPSMESIRLYTLVRSFDTWYVIWRDDVSHSTYDSRHCSMRDCKRVVVVPPHLRLLIKYLVYRRIIIHFPLPVCWAIIASYAQNPLLSPRKGLIEASCVVLRVAFLRQDL